MIFKQAFLGLSIKLGARRFSFFAISEPLITAWLLTESGFSAKKDNPLVPRVQKAVSYQMNDTNNYVVITYGWEFCIKRFI